MKRKTSSRENTKDVPNPKMEKEVPFGDPPGYYKYKCSHCQFENEMNEVNVDVAFGWTKKEQNAQGVLWLYLNALIVPSKHMSVWIKKVRPIGR